MQNKVVVVKGKYVGIFRISFRYMRWVDIG